jgi:hypothetical protein
MWISRRISIIDFPRMNRLKRKLSKQTSDRVVRLETYPFSKIEATYQVKPDGKLGKPLKRDLVALKSNPYYFGYDIYAPKTMEQGGPFTDRSRHPQQPTRNPFRMDWRGRRF